MGLLAVAQALTEVDPPLVDVWVVANTGEEGLGDLRGMRAAVDRLDETLGACIVIEGMGLGRIVHQALGSRRFRIEASAPGGHSWSDFGSASAVHTIVQLAADLAQLSVPTTPRTSFNIGRIQGGTSVNTIAQHAQLELDLRSEAGEALAEAIAETETIVKRFQSDEWNQKGVTVSIETIGDRPTGDIPADHPLVLAAEKALASANVAHVQQLRMSSTDANIPLSRGIPAVCVGVTEGGDAHRLSEWIRTDLLPQGTQHLLLLTWWATLWLSGEAE
jgi:acetylornithine deacetylase/succinyl-diaminopimelate desuccinylase-like protein